ncbi:hypothetical protein CU665_28450 [Pseudomonas syringae pv. actinidifoliorum]|nr:hypothetical protein [Pseudomonas syringae pv. actinidifoliorum]NAT39583.1 hypothetical protein [Pseudomonas syringae pv. actinidifoliorum]
MTQVWLSVGQVVQFIMQLLYRLRFVLAVEIQVIQKRWITIFRKQTILGFRFALTTCFRHVEIATLKKEIRYRSLHFSS